MKFFEKINKMDTPLSRPIKKKEKRHITDIRNERQNVITDITEIKRVTREYDKQLHTHEFDNLDEVNEFLEKYQLLKLTEE